MLYNEQQPGDPMSPSPLYTKPALPMQIFRLILWSDSFTFISAIMVATIAIPNAIKGWLCNLEQIGSLMLCEKSYVKI